MPRYRLRTLLIVLGIGPMVLAVVWRVTPQLLESYREWRRPPPVMFTVTPRIIIQEEEEQTLRQLPPEEWP